VTSFAVHSSHLDSRLCSVITSLYEEGSRTLSQYPTALLFNDTQLILFEPGRLK
jgi:hypothetical protein